MLSCLLFKSSSHFEFIFVGFFFSLFAASTAYGSSQFRDQLQTTVTTSTTAAAALDP